MLRNIAITILVAVSVPCLAQDDLADNDLKYLDGFLKECKSRQAEYIREIERNSMGRFQATLVSVHGDTVLIGEYADRTCQTPHGRFVYFHENGQVESMGYYNSSRKVGTWKRFNKKGESKSFIKYPGQVPQDLYATSVKKDDVEDSDTPTSAEEETAMANPEQIAKAEAAIKAARAAEGKMVIKRVKIHRPFSGPGTGKHLLRGVPMVW